MAILECWIDGACERENPGGTASIGVVVKQNGVEVHRTRRVIGAGATMSNNVAEYSAMLAFLTWYIETGQTEKAVVRSDSKLVVNQLAGLWRVNGGLYYPTYDRVMKMISQQGLAKWLTFEWVPREQNTEADTLSRQALIEVGITPVVR